MINEVKKDRISYGDLPNKYEAGTMATAQVIAFDQSIKFLESVGIDNVMKHEAELVEYGQELLQKNNSVKLIGNPKNKGGVLSSSQFISKYSIPGRLSNSGSSTIVA